MNTEKKIMSSIIIGTLLLLGLFAYVSKPKIEPTTTKVQSVDTSGAWATGPQNAEVTMVEFADFQCPACGKAHPVIEKLLQEYEGKVRFIHRHFPIESVHPYTIQAAQASEAAGEQGKFWPMHQLLFEHQSEWSQSKDPMSFFEQYAKSLDLNLTDFKTYIKENKGTAAIERDIKEGEKLGVQATPTIFINEKGISGVPTYAELKSYIELALKSGSG